MLARHDMIEKFTRVDERIYAYLLAHQPPEHPILTELRSLTEGLAEAKMQSTVEQGHFLALLVRADGSAPRARNRDVHRHQRARHGASAARWWFRDDMRC
jgi:hypothetical protein